MLLVGWRIARPRPLVRVPRPGTSSALFALILATSILRLGWAAGVEASNDEAYTYLYTVYPDWSQFDHPPMTMLVERLGLALFGSVSPLALRIGFVILGAASTWLMAAWTARLFDESRAGFFAALSLNLTGYFALKAGSFALPDGPMTFFALATLWALTEAFAKPPRIRPWLVVGACWGLALASKYHAVFLPAGALAYAALTPTARRHLLSPGPYLAVAVGLLGFLPTLVWNANHEWASFAYQGGRAVAFGFHPEKLANYLAVQAVLWYPWIWIALAFVFVGRLRAWRSLADTECFLLVQSAVPLGFFFAVALVRGAMPHWALIGLLPLYPFLGRAWAMSTMRRRLIAMVATALIVPLLILVNVRSGWVPVLKGDPCREFSGWESVGRELTSRGHMGRPNSFLFTEDWHASGHLAFEAKGRIPVLCYRADDARGFAYWSKPEDWLGRDGLLIDRKDTPGLVEHYAPYFRRVELLTTFPMTRGGRPMLTVRVYLCTEQIKPYPFRGHTTLVAE